MTSGNGQAPQSEGSRSTETDRALQIRDQTIDKVSDRPDRSTQKELDYYHRQALNTTLKSARQDIKERKIGARFAWGGSIGWMCFVAAMVWGDAAGSLNISDNVEMALLVSAPSGIVGVALVVMRYLFPNHKGQDKS